MTDRLAEIMDSLYDWHHNDNNKIVAPKCILPECIKERIRYFLPQMDNGLTFKGCMEYVLATQENEKKLSEDYENYSYDDWLPVSDKVEEWHKSYYDYRKDMLGHKWQLPCYMDMVRKTIKLNMVIIILIIAIY